MKTLLSAATLAVVLAGAAQAQQIRPAPQPGLWEHDMQMLINGQDVFAQMRQMQAQMMKDMPPEVRQQMAAMMGDMGGPQKQCLTAEQANRHTDPRKALEEMQREQPHCRFEPLDVSGSTLRFKGRCNDPQGFTGDVSGEYTLRSAREFDATYRGKGRMNMPMAPGMPGGGATDGAVDMRTSVKGRWVSADCGDVKPQSGR